MEITQFSPVRSGSTLVYNVLRTVFPHAARITKTHNLPANTADPRPGSHPCLGSLVTTMRQSGTLVIITTMRHPYNSILSICFRRGHPLKPKYIQSAIREYLTYGGRDMLVHPRPNSVLRYERFASNTPEAFAYLLHALGIDDDMGDDKAKLQRFHIRHMHKLSKQLKTFDKVDPHTNIHGKHIGPYKGQTDYRTLLTTEQIQSLFHTNSELVRLCHMYGYDMH